MRERIARSRGAGDTSFARGVPPAPVRTDPGVQRDLQAWEKFRSDYRTTVPGSVASRLTYLRPAHSAHPVIERSLVAQ